MVVRRGARGAAREGARCLVGRSSAERTGHAGETPEQALHAREGAGKRERPAAGPCGGRVRRRCGAMRGLEQLRRTLQSEWRIYFYI
jgi:hypothetical protein